MFVYLKIKILEQNNAADTVMSIEQVRFDEPLPFK